MDKNIAKAIEIATEELRACYFKQGIVAGTHHFTDYWARDAFFASFGSLAIGDTKIVREFWLKATNESQLSERKCPSCMQKLKEFTVGEYNRQVRLDLCRMCQLIWFDRNELEMFPDVKKERPDTKRHVASPRAGIETPFVYENETVGGIAYLCLQALCETIRLFLFPR